ncbi:lysozyme inhibitor LprI family protein [Martelella sp. HB161492]|uniref:lysozyme inhibitor LprI family protein n=1 Tax=Martelella sp. HB161492 TaxID=2720726 RepID=UPI0015919329|nr:lysozyme inhibitor LprI family protein [Martelella sp. HB161492]
MGRLCRGCLAGMVLSAGSSILLPVSVMAGDMVSCDAAAAFAARLDCAEEAFRASDERLTSAFATMLLLAGNLERLLPEGEQGATASLMRSQRAWVDYRDSACTSRGFLFRGTEDEPFVVSRCMNELTLDRLDCLDRVQKVLLLRDRAAEAGTDEFAFGSVEN